MKMSSQTKNFNHIKLKFCAAHDTWIPGTSVVSKRKLLAQSNHEMFAVDGHFNHLVVFQQAAQHSPVAWDTALVKGET